MNRFIFLAVIVLSAGAADGQTFGLAEIVNRAIQENGEIRIARLEVDKARARLSQAQLRPNPTLEVEHASGRFVGSAGDRELSVELSVPLEVYGQRARRIELARAEVTLQEAELTSKERELTVRIIADYIEALSASRELRVFDEILDLDIQTVKFVQIRVNEGESAPLELNLLQTEIERLRAQRHLAEGRFRVALSKLKYYAGVAYEMPFPLREDIETATLPVLPATLETSIDVGSKNRPEIRLAVLEEQLATAGLRLVRSQSKPDISATVRYTQGRAGFDDPRGEFFQRDRGLTFGVSIGLPVFNRNQGAKAEAEIAIRQAQERRIFSEQVVKSEIVAAFYRIEAAKRALATLETAVLPRSRENIETIRRVYEIGELKITDLIAEQRKLLDANRDLTTTLTERYRAHADLLIAIGAISFK